MSRAHLPNRRPATAFEIEHFDPLAGPRGMAVKLHVTLGCYEDGKPGEVFITVCGGTGRGSMMEALAREIGILISLGIQHGIPIETMRRAVMRDEKNQPQTLAGAVLDAMEG